jgi:hypothetical protein
MKPHSNNELLLLKAKTNLQSHSNKKQLPFLTLKEKLLMIKAKTSRYHT